MKQGPPDDLLLFSGGIDSALLLAWALHRRRLVALLEIDHPARPRGERRAARRLQAHYGTTVHRATLPSLQPASQEIPGYLASRNLAFHALAQAVAEAAGARRVLAGHVARDHEDFPDARPQFLNRLQRLAATGRPDGARIPIQTPLARMSRAARQKLIRRLEVPVNLTWSCWRDGARPCNRCEKCQRRAEWMGALRGT